MALPVQHPEPPRATTLQDLPTEILSNITLRTAQLQDLDVERERDAAREAVGNLRLTSHLMCNIVDHDPRTQETYQALRQPGLTREKAADHDYRENARKPEEAVRVHAPRSQRVIDEMFLDQARQKFKDGLSAPDALRASGFDPVNRPDENLLLIAARRDDPDLSDESKPKTREYKDLRRTNDSVADLLRDGAFRHLQEDENLTAPTAISVGHVSKPRHQEDVFVYAIAHDAKYRHMLAPAITAKHSGEQALGSYMVREAQYIGTLASLDRKVRARHAIAANHLTEPNLADELLQMGESRDGPDVAPSEIRTIQAI